MPHVISANKLSDGIVVFLSHDNRWTEQLSQARLLADKAALESATKRAGEDASRNLVVDVLPVEVTVTPEGAVPKHIRDRIRATGPTVHRDHGKQAAL